MITVFNVECGGRKLGDGSWEPACPNLKGAGGA
jgi:hypothetical protein